MATYTSFLLLFVVLFSFCLISSATEVTYDDRALKINGERKIILSGSIHYPRSTAEVHQIFVILFYQKVENICTI